MNGSTLVARLWHGALALIVFAALVIQLVLTIKGVPDSTGVIQPVLTRFVRLLSYFTIQSNILLLVAVAMLARRTSHDGRFWRVIRLDAMLGIMITGLVYATVLAATNHPTGADWWSNLGFHYLAPPAAVLGWLVFGPRPRINGATLGWAGLWPLLWIGYTLAHGAISHWYPYPFTDVGTFGYVAVLRNMFFVLLIAAVFALILRLLDSRLPMAAEHVAPTRADASETPAEASSQTITESS